MAVNTNNLSLEEKRNLMSQLESEIQIDEVFVDKIKSFISDAETSRDYYTHKTNVVGKQSEQAVNSDGEPLYAVKGHWRKYTMQAIKDELELTDEQMKSHVTPYYEDITETTEVDADELDSWDKRQYDGLTKVIDVLKTLI